MIHFKKMKAFFIAMPLALLVTYSAHAASYTVAPGDSLYTIGKLFNTNSSSIMENNSLANSTIYPGQVLNIPSSTYTVKSGDSLHLIAQKYGITLYSLRKANNRWNDYIYPGQKLVLPGVSLSNQTAASNNAVNRASSAAVIPYTSSDLDLLARLITAEADGETYKAKVGVGAVVVNRVKSPDFPNSIRGVIYQKDAYYYQFTPVENGWINKAATQDAINAAYDALHGSDPTHGALFYFDNSATNKWLWSKPIAAYIDKMVYVY